MPDNKPAKKTCFIVGPIGEAGSPVRKLADWMRDGIIKPVLEDEEFDYHVKRADEDTAPGSISNAVINDLVNSDLVIADLTGFNPNAFYELGIRHALQKPTIHMIAEPVRLPFDNADQRTIFVNILDYQEVLVARKALRNGVRAVNSGDYHVSNPVTQAASANAMKNSADPKDQVIANLQERIERLENRSRPPNKGFEYLRYTNPDQTTLDFDETAADPNVSRASQLLKLIMFDPSKNESLPLGAKLALWDRDANALSKCMAAGVDADVLKQAQLAANPPANNETKGRADEGASSDAAANKESRKK